jgi:hypothetical protein
MAKFNNMWRYSIACLLVFLSGVCAFAQRVVFTASPSANKIGLQDQVQITYSIQNADNMQSVNPPREINDDFLVVGGPFQQQSTSIINGDRSFSISISYLLQPKRNGTLTIPAATAKDVDGRTYQSNSVQIQVVQGSLAHQGRQQSQDPFYDDPFRDPFAAMMQQRRQRVMQQQQRREEEAVRKGEVVNMNDLENDLFIRVSVDKNKVHVGEQITANYKLYARLPMNVSISKLPSLNGFWTQDFDIPKNGVKPVEEIVDGKKYQVFLLKKSALFPQQTGTLQLDPAEAEGVARIVQKVKQRNPFAGMFDDDFFSAFGSMMMSDPFFDDDIFSTMAYKDVKVKLKSKPVNIQVVPLPEDKKPVDFGGAVGSFNMTASLDKKQLTTDDVANIVVRITGSGNLKLFEAPKLSLPNGLSSFDPVIVDTITGRSTTITGSKIITYSITPGTPGDYDIPAVSFTYFNPQSSSYTTLQTQSFKLHVTAGKGYKEGTKQTLLADIHGNVTTPISDFTFNSKPLLYTAGYWSMYALPLFAFIGLIVWKRRDDELSQNVVLLKSKRANKIALKRLATAQKLLQLNSRKPFYEEVSKAIWLYLSDKLNIPLSELSRERARIALGDRNIPASLQQRIEQVIDECETSLYAPVGTTRPMSEVYTQAVDIISKLEEQFNA